MFGGERETEKEREDAYEKTRHPTHSIIWGGGLKYANTFVCITIKAEMLFTLRVSKASRRPLGHTSEATQMMLLSFIFFH